MDTRPPESQSLLTLDDLRRWKAERAAQARVLEAATAAIAVLDIKIAAGMVFLPGAMQPDFLSEEADLPAEKQAPPQVTPAQPPAEAPKPKKPTSFNRLEWLNDKLLAQVQGVTHEEILQMCADSDGPPETIQTVKKLVEGMTRRGRLRKRGDFFYHPALMRRLEAGELQDRERGVGRSSDIRSVIKDAITAIGPATPKAIIARLWEMDEARVIMERNPQYAYNMLSRMVQAGELDRIGNLYRLPSIPARVEAAISSPTPNRVNSN